ncbi:MAG: CRTAC1 family protein [Pseudomonadota bacterium]
MQQFQRVSLVLMVLPGVALAGPRFEPVAAPAHQYVGGWEHFVGGGIAAFDCDGDDLPELYAAGGEAPAMLLRNRSGGAVRVEADTPEALVLTGVTGAYPVDVDDDGVLDLAVLRVGENRLFKGGPNCAFTPMALESPDAWTTAFSATWEAGATAPTLVFGNYVDRSDPDGPFEACDVHHLYRPGADGYGAPELLGPGFCTLSMLFSDWNRSGRADLRVSNDRHYYVRGGEEQMWAMETEPRLYTQAEGWRHHMLWGMGIASRDITGDGKPEVYLSSMGDQKLQALEDGAEGPSYQTVPFERGTAAQRPHVGGDGRPSTGWHTAFGDVTNDGLDDLFVSKGNVDQMMNSAMDDPNSLLEQQADGRFVEVSAEAGVASMVRSRGAALVDLNGDGLLDLAVNNRRAPLEIYHNVTEAPGNWLSVSLRQNPPNRLALGAIVEVQADRLHTREWTIGGGQAGGHFGVEHFGLGAADAVRLRVIWPDGEVGAWLTLDTNQAVTLTR